MKTLGRVFVGIIYAILYAPMAVMVLFSFNASDSTTKFSGFSFRWYENLVSDYGLRTVIGNTMLSCELPLMLTLETQKSTPII